MSKCRYRIIWLGVFLFIHLRYKFIFGNTIFGIFGKTTKGLLHFNGMVCIIICMKSVNDIKKNGNSLFFKSGHVPLSILILFVFQKHLVKQKNIISFADMKLFFLSTYAQSIFIDVIISMKLLNGIFLILVVRVKFSVIEFPIWSLLI